VTSLCRALSADEADWPLFKKPMLSAVAARKQAARKPSRGSFRFLLSTPAGWLPGL